LIEPGFGPFGLVKWTPVFGPPDKVDL
jgi:hypothetical protein